MNRVQRYRRTAKGISANIYSNQRRCCEHRGYLEPEYDLKEFRDWLFSQSNFQTLFDNWVKSGYDKWLVPSVDRIDDYKTYSVKNIRLVTWKENFEKGHLDRQIGNNNKQSKPVVQYDKNWNQIKEYHSVMEASRQTGLSQGNISSVARGERKSAGGYKWGYVSQYNLIPK